MSDCPTNAAGGRKAKQVPLNAPDDDAGKLQFSLICDNVFL